MNISDSPAITLVPNTIGITVHFVEHGMALLHKIGQVQKTELTKDLKFKKKSRRRPNTKHIYRSTKKAT